MASGLAGPAHAQQKVRIGALKLSSSAPLFIGVDKGYFKEFGVEPELIFFQAAAPIATALATGQIDVGATGVTAALYNIVLGGEQMWIVADKGREWPGYPLTGIVIQKELYDSGLRSIADLKGKRIGITTLGSTFHYHLGNILEKHGLKLADVRVVPLQTMPAAIEALRGRHGRGAGLRQDPVLGRRPPSVAGGRHLLLQEVRRRSQARRRFYEGLRQGLALLP
jgi:NitT/TauT family transport system substrate-binding protein